MSDSGSRGAISSKKWSGDGSHMADEADNRLIHKMVIAQGMATPAQADECLRAVLEARGAKTLPDILFEKGYLNAEDHAILLRIFAPAPPPTPLPPSPASVEADTDAALEKIVTATGLLTVDFLEAAKETRRRGGPGTSLQSVFLDEGYLTRFQLEDMLQGIQKPTYRCEGCGKPYALDRGRPPRKCPSCGLSLPKPGVPVSLEVSLGGEGVRPVGTLTVLLGVNRGFVYEVAEGARVTLGRQTSNKIRLFGKQVSRKHCEIVPEGNTLVIRDLQSSFGTYVNGRAVSEHVLSDGDLIKVGPSVLEFRTALDPSAAEALDEGVEEILFGRIAVRLGLVTQRQVDEAVALQETTHREWQIGKILMERGGLDEPGLLRVLETQRRNLKARGYYTEETTENTLFGRIALRSRLINEAQLNEALRTQAKMDALSGVHMKLGEILVRKGAMGEADVQKILSIQGHGDLALPLPGYKVLSKIGEGGMGAVFLARQVSLDREVAVKLLAPKLARDAFFIDRFMREARAAAALSHENIIRAIDVGEASGHYYFVMEYVEGETAHDLVQQKGALDETAVLDIGIQVCRALDHAHQHGIVHRDVKPENIMITAQGIAKLCDLGLARNVASTDGRSTEEAVGTPNYVSPEQARGDAQIDIRTDIYSLGATLYHLATGSMPFKKLGPPLVVMARHITEQIPPPRKINPNLSEGFGRVLVKMMVKDPARRYPSPADTLDELLLVRAGRTPKNVKIGSAVSTIAKK